MGTCIIKNQRGQAFVIVAVCMVTVLAAVFLALNAGLGYMNKAKLNAAVDAAAAAAVVGATHGENESEQIASGIAAANQFFATNYPAGFFNSNTVLIPETAIRFGRNANDNGVIYADVSSTATMPVTFMSMLGFDSLKVKATAQTIRRDIDLVFVVDNTASIRNNGNVDGMVKATKSFVDELSVTTDRVSLVGFGLGANALVPFKNDYSRGFHRGQMKTAIDNMTFNSHTNTAQALWMALGQHRKLKASTSPSSLRVIVLFTDGWPSAFSSKLRFNPYSKCFPQHWANTTKIDTTTTSTLITTTVIPSYTVNTVVGWEFINGSWQYNWTITGSYVVPESTTTSTGTPQIATGSTTSTSTTDTQGPVNSYVTNSSQTDFVNSTTNSTTNRQVDVSTVTTNVSDQIPEPDPYIIGSMSLGGTEISGFNGYQDINPSPLQPNCSSTYLGENVMDNDKHILEYPQYYNAFPNNDYIPLNSPRPVPLTGFNTMSQANRRVGIYNAGANIAEGIARKARQEGILILTVVLGSGPMNNWETHPLDDLAPDIQIPDTGKTVLGCIANTDPDESPNGCRAANAVTEPTGIACYADSVQNGNSAELDKCYRQVLNKILRFTK